MSLSLTCNIVGIGILFLIFGQLHAHFHTVSIYSIIAPNSATEEQILAFHAEDYVKCLKNLSDLEDEEKLDEDAEEYGLGKC